VQILVNSTSSERDPVFIITCSSLVPSFPYSDFIDVVTEWVYRVAAGSVWIGVRHI